MVYGAVYYICFKTASIKEGEYKVKCECNSSVVTFLT